MKNRPRTGIGVRTRITQVNNTQSILNFYLMAIGILMLTIGTPAMVSSRWPDCWGGGALIFEIAVFFIFLMSFLMSKYKLLFYINSIGLIISSLLIIWMAVTIFDLL